MSNKSIIVGLALSILLAGSINASAEDFESEIKHRKALMSAVRAHFSTLFTMVRASDSDQEAIKFHADQLAEVTEFIANRQKALYPEGSLNEELSSAKPEVWQKWADFESKGQSLAKNAKALAAAASGNDSKALRAAFNDVRKECSGCHKVYKVKD